MANRLKNPLKRWETLVFVFMLFFLLYTLPLLTDWGLGRPVFLYIYFFAVLIVHTACLALFARACRPAKPETGQKTETG